MSRIPTGVLFVVLAANLPVSLAAQLTEPARPADNTTAAFALNDVAQVEPDVLAGNVANVAVEGFDAPAEPPLPVPEDEDSEDVVERESEEVAATPRRFRYAISVEARGVYDDNITLSRGAAKRSDYSGQLSVGLTMGLGDIAERAANYLSVSYTPTAYAYAETSEFNTIEHVFLLQGRWRPGRFAFTLTQRFQSVQSTNLGVANELGGFNNQVNLDVGGRFRINTYETRLEAAGDMTGKTSLRLALSHQLVEPENLISSETVSGSIGVGYDYAAKLQLGFDLTAGQNFVAGASPDQTFEQITLRGSYQVTGKLSVTGSGGIEFRQSEGGTADQVAPVYQLTLSYNPFDGTRLTAAAVGRTQSSASNFGQDFTSQQFTVTAQQRFFQRVFTSLSAGYQTQSYFSTLSGISTERDDNYYFVALGIDVRITKFWFAGIFYVHRQNDSTLDFYTFDDNQIGIRSNVQF